MLVVVALGIVGFECGFESVNEWLEFLCSLGFCDVKMSMKDAHGLNFVEREIGMKEVDVKKVQVFFVVVVVCGVLEGGIDDGRFSRHPVAPFAVHEHVC